MKAVVLHGPRDKRFETVPDLKPFASHRFSFDQVLGAMRYSSMRLAKS
jgi:hypothetical protein